MTSEEIRQNFQYPIDETDLRVALGELCGQQQVFHIGPFYALHNSKQMIENRLLANRLAETKIKKAFRLTQFISRFPFVEAAFISGSLSKMVATPGSDIDYFVVAKPGKVWIARTFLHLFKKLTFINGRQHDFCMNYFIDLSHPQIEEKNLYTAIELVTLKAHPKDQGLLAYLLHQNQWTKEFLPNYPIHQQLDQTFNIPSRFIDRILFDPINKALMHLTDWTWRKKWKRKGYPMEDYDVAFKTRIHVSKNHPDNYLKKILNYCDEAGIPTT